MSEKKQTTTTESTKAEAKAGAEAEVKLPIDEVPTQLPMTPQETTQAILSEITKRDKIIRSKDEQILNLLKERVEIVALLDDALNELSRANTRNITLNRRMYSSMSFEFESLKARLHPRGEENKADENI